MGDFMTIQRIAATLGLLVITAAPALSADCAKWKAEMWEVEGGTAMTAHICQPAKGTDREALLYVQCGEPGTLVLNYDDGGRGDPPGGDPEWKGPAVISTGDQSREETLSYQAMDGILFLPLGGDSPVLAMLKSGSQITVAPKEAAFKTVSFPLSGSSAALAKLTASCGKN
ncbi:MAG: hypothetical protein DI528_06455 [Shinella sp.]|nr:MAG: hypothetical protein DI528_06455 [Shinella sp.]